MADAQTISAEKLCALSGLTDRRHRQLAAEGYFPPPIESQYALGTTISGLFRYYREHNQRTKEKLVNTKDEKTQKESRLLDLKIAREERSVVPIADLERLHLHVASVLKTTLFQRLGREMGAKCQGKTAKEINVFGRGVAVELCGTFGTAIQDWKDSDETVAIEA